MDIKMSYSMKSRAEMDQNDCGSALLARAVRKALKWSESGAWRWVFFGMILGRWW